MDKQGTWYVRVAIYIRVSTDEQAKHGFWIEMQKQALLDAVEYKSKHHWWTHKPKWLFIDDWKSWSDLNRPQYKKMMEWVKNKEFDLIAVWKIDRLSRSLSHLLKTFEDLKKYGVSFYSLKEDMDFSWPMWRLVFHMFGALAEFERETIKSRTIEWKIASARMWNYIGNWIPYWYKKTPNKRTNKWSVLEIEKKEAKIVNDIFKWFVFEQINYEEITRRLNDLWVSKWVAWRNAVKKTKWYATTVINIIKNSSYMWIRVERIKDWEWKKQEIIVNVPKIIPEMLYRQAQLRVDEISRTKGERWWGLINYLLSRKIVDTETWRKFVWVKRTKWWYSYRRKFFIHPTTWTRFKNKEIPAQALEEFVWSYIEKVINNPKEFYKQYKRQTNTSKELENLFEQEQIHEENIIKQKNKIALVDSDYYGWKIDESRQEEVVNECQRVIAYCHTELDKLKKQIEILLKQNQAETAIQEFSDNFKQNIGKLTIEQKKLLVDMLIDRIEVSETNKQISVKVIFQFEQPKDVDLWWGVEPKHDLKERKLTKKHELDSQAGGGNPTSVELFTSKISSFLVHNQHDWFPVFDRKIEEFQKQKS